MKANELRIGNWFIPISVMNLEQTPTQLTLMMMAQLCHLPNGEAVNFTPIPLTEEWLLKFGFENGNMSFQFHKKNICVCLEYTTYRVYHISNGWNINLAGELDDKISIWDIKENSSVIFNLKYVHQLQNLYYCLTGEELKLQP